MNAMHDVGGWTRRRLLKVSGAAVGAGVASHFGLAGHAELLQPAAEAQDVFVYTATAGAAAEQHGVQVYAVRGSRWRPLQLVPSAAPSSVTIAPDRRTLFVTNGVGRHGGLATGSVEAWAIHPATGTLTRLNRQGLALAAVFPTHAAVSPDGTTLAVSAADGGSCVLLPIRDDGSVGEPIAVRRQLRFESSAPRHSAAPTTQLCFAPDGKLLIADFSEHAISAFAFASGPLELVQRVSIPEACVSASLQRGANFVEISLRDSMQRTVGGVSYARELTPVRSLREGTTRLATHTFDSVFSPGRAVQAAAGSSAQDAFCIDTTHWWGSCLVRPTDRMAGDALAPTAMAWVHA